METSQTYGWSYKLGSRCDDDLAALAACAVRNFWYRTGRAPFHFSLDPHKPLDVGGQLRYLIGDLIAIADGLPHAVLDVILEKDECHFYEAETMLAIWVKTSTQ
jgi:hypothetical protein